MNIYIMSVGSKSNHQNMFTHFIRDVSFIVTFSDFWYSQMSILSRDADMVMQTCIWLRGPSDLDPDIYYIKSASCITAGHHNSCLCFVKSAASHG